MKLPKAIEDWIDKKWLVLTHYEYSDTDQMRNTSVANYNKREGARALAEEKLMPLVEACRFYACKGLYEPHGTHPMGENPEDYPDGYDVLNDGGETAWKALASVGIDVVPEKPK